MLQLFTSEDCGETQSQSSIELSGTITCSFIPASLYFFTAQILMNLIFAALLISFFFKFFQQHDLESSLPLQMSDMKDLNDLWCRYDKQNSGELRIQDIYFMTIEMRFLIEIKKISAKVNVKNIEMVTKQKAQLKKISKEYFSIIRVRQTNEDKFEQRGFLYNDQGQKIQITKLIHIFSKIQIESY